ncbi:MAG: RelA/SpoT family protein [Rikenellaceae bacterium]
MEYSESDKILIDDKFNMLMASCRLICKSDKEIDVINKAYFTARDAHQGVLRRSGEPYIIHPIAVAQIVVDEIGLGYKSVAAALLHDVVEDTDATVEDIERQFGKTIARMVDGLTKMSGVFKTDTSEQAENFKKMLLTLSDDMRVIIVKIADRLHNMRTLGSMPPHKQLKIISETIYLFAPLAQRLGLYAIKSELEDLSLKYRFPEEYKQITDDIAKTEQDRGAFIEEFNTPIITQLKEAGIDFEISGRVKSVYSIWNKMTRKSIPFEEVYDLFAIRIVFKPSPLIPEKAQCWHIYSIITDIYTPKPDRIRDWVNIPKANGYEALHSTVMGPHGIWAEVQIRSERMDNIAERGFAAHWRYKNNEELNEGDDAEYDKLIRKVRDALSSQTEDAVEFLDNFKSSLYTSEIVVFTPTGESRTLPKGATVLDFAYDIHSKIGNSAIGAKINHKIESIFSPISSGDQIEIITSSKVTPKVEWLEHVVTGRARQNIKSYLKKTSQNNTERGIELLENRLKEFGIVPRGNVVRKIIAAYGCSSKDELYSKLGQGIINLNDIEKHLKENSDKKTIKFWNLQIGNPFNLFNGKQKSEDSKLRGPEDSNHNFEIATCCNPIPGDEVIGYKQDQKIMVHKRSCDEFIRLATRHGNRITNVSWSSYKAVSHLSILNIRGIDRFGMLLEMVQLITGELNINIRELSIHSHDGIFECTISIYVKDINDLKMIMTKVGRVKGIEKVTRIENSTK